MKFALLVGATLAIGLLAGRMDLLPWLGSELGTYVLFGMIFLVLFTAGGDRRTYELVRTQGATMLLVPAATVAGNLLAVLLLAMFYDGLSFRQTLAVGSGFGYYTFSSVFIQEMEGPTVGAVALVANVLREVATLVLAPVVFRYLGGNACVAMGGATVSDSTLPIIAKACGKEIVPVAFVSGLIITIIVPFMLMAILG